MPTAGAGGLGAQISSPSSIRPTLRDVRQKLRADAHRFQVLLERLSTASPSTASGTTPHGHWHGGVAMTRKRLHSRRLSEIFDLEVNGLHYVCTFSRFDDGRVAEVFLQNNKSQSQSDSNARDSAIAASLALQFGCPLDVLRRA